MSTPAHIAAVERIAEDAANLPTAYVRDMFKSLQLAQAEVTKNLSEWLATHKKDGAERFTAQKYRETLLQLNKAIAVLSKRLPADMQRTLAAQNKGAGNMAHDHLEREVAAMAEKFPATQPIDINKAAAFKRADSLLIPRHRNSANRYGNDITNDFRQQLAIGTLKGESFDELTNRLVRHGGPKGLVSLRGTLGEEGSYGEVIAEGLFKRYRYWAERLVRTEGMNSYNAHHQSALHEADNDDPGYHKRWDASIDKRTCTLCRDLDGKTVPVKDVFPGGYPHPPAHPNDRCRITPWRPEWDAKPETAKPAPAPAPKPAVAVAALPTPPQAIPRDVAAETVADQIAERRRAATLAI